jgi:hypothetical protein
MTNSATPGLEAGTAAVDITPALGTHLAGSGMGDHRPAERVLDPLFARATVFALGARRAAIVALDTLAVTAEYTAKIRAGAADLGIDADAVVVHAQQNHSAPSCGPLMLDPDFPIVLTPDEEHLTGAEAAYCGQAVAGAVAALEAALADLQPVQLGLGRSVRDDLAFNRRAITRDGGVAMPWFYRGEDLPLGRAHYSHMEGPADPEVGVAAFRDAAGVVSGMLLHHSCHPVNMFALDKRTVTADWPGAWVAGMAPHCSGAPLVINGCCGDINPWPPMMPDFVPDHQRMGAELARTAAAVLGSLAYVDVSALRWARRSIALAYREVPPARRDAVAAVLDQDPQLHPPRGADGEVDPTWFRAMSTRCIDHCRAREPQFRYEIQALRIGDLAVLALPGEPFAAGQLEIKLQSPAALTLVAHMCSHYVGYIPTRAAAARDGHETNADCTYWAKLAPDSLERVVAASTDMLTELFT